MFFREPNRSPATSDRRSLAREGIATLQVACAILHQTSPELVRVMHLTIPLADFPLPGTAVVDLAERVAAENGLLAQAEVRAPVLLVSLARAGSADLLCPKR